MAESEQELKYIDQLAQENIPINTEKWIEYIKTQRQRALQPLLVQGKNLKKFPDVSIEPAKSQYRKFRVWLKQMEQYLEMSPEIKEKTQIEVALTYVQKEEIFHFPKDEIDTAQRLMAKWEGENWGANEVNEVENEEEGIEDEDESEVSEGPAVKRRRKSSTARNTDGGDDILLPPTEHPIFGEKGGKRGIMYGLALKKGRRRTFALNPALRQHKRSGKAYGSNGLKVGAWFPYQIAANFHGAHSAPQAGISGNTETGAYSIVVSGHYDDLDEDGEEELYYSGSRSHDNEVREAPAAPSQGTLAMHASLRTGRLVRVLRASSGKRTLAPTAGLRYDGLYKVVDIDYPRNRKGGMYEQFKLIREPGQRQIDHKRPTPEEQADLKRVGRGYA